MSTATPAHPDHPVLRTGQVRIKGSGSLSSWGWKVKSVSLTDKALVVTPDYKIPFDHITKVERVDLKPYCLLLEASNNKRWHFSFQNDGELYDWQEDVYSRCPKIGGGNPWGFVHGVHVGFDPSSGTFNGLPAQWNETIGAPGADPRLRAAFNQTPHPAPDPPSASPLPLPTNPAQSAVSLRNPNAAAAHVRSSTSTSSTEPTSPPTPPGYKRIVPSPQLAVLAARLAYRPESFFAWRWNPRYLVLDQRTLTIAKSQGSTSPLTLNLRDIAALERSERRPFCLLVQIKSGKRYFLSFDGDSELYDWQEAMYSRSPLAGIGAPTEFVHNVHVGIDSGTGDFTGVPDQWRSVLLNIPQQ